MKEILVHLIVKDKKYLPCYATKDAAGADLLAAIEKNVELLPNQSLAVPTGIFVEIPQGYEIQIRPRSGLAHKFQITVLNAPGTIDSDYRGEIFVILINHGKKNFVIEPLMRIAQMVLTPVTKASFQIKDNLSKTQRGEGGLGHTGLYGSTV